MKNEKKYAGFLIITRLKRLQSKTTSVSQSLVNLIYPLMGLRKRTNSPSLPFILLLLLQLWMKLSQQPWFAWAFSSALTTQLNSPLQCLKTCSFSNFQVSASQKGVETYTNRFFFFFSHSLKTWANGPKWTLYCIRTVLGWAYRLSKRRLRLF